MLCCRRLSDLALWPVHSLELDVFNLFCPRTVTTWPASLGWPTGSAGETLGLILAQQVPLSI